MTEVPTTPDPEQATDPRPRLTQRMLVVSAVVHHRWQGKVYGYTPYVRELDAWAHLFGEVRIVAPVIDGPPPDDCAPFGAPNVTVSAMPVTGGATLRKKARQLVMVPWLALRLITEMRWAEAIQVRCPSNLGVLAVLLAPLFSRRLHCKYAGMWGAFDGEPRSSRFQRRVLVSRWWRGPVSVYGPAPTDPPKIHAAFSTALTEAQLAVRRPPDGRPPGAPVRVLFVGRLSAAKNVDTVLAAVADVRSDGGDCVLEIIGDGPMRTALESLAGDLGIADAVTFRGSLPVDGVLAAYHCSDVMVLVSNSEGWPKVMVEAMAFGVVVVGNDRGLVPTIVADGRGFSIPPGDGDALTEKLDLLVRDHEARKVMAAKATVWAQPFSLERFADELRELLSLSWPAAGTAKSGSGEALR